MDSGVRLESGRQFRREHDIAYMSEERSGEIL